MKNKNSIRITVILGMTALFFLSYKFYDESLLYSAAVACGLLISLRSMRLIKIIDGVYEIDEEEHSNLFQYILALLYTCVVSLCIYQYSHKSFIIAILISIAYLMLEIWVLIKRGNLKRKQKNK
ncbi:Uncharacterised protein [uncultured Eubacterium sp.]|nr:Uncharacterised protein [uncultured Eubacterium sp.]